MRAASLAVQIEGMEIDLLAERDTFDPDRHANLAALLLRTLGAMGLADFRKSHREQATSKKARAKSAGPDPLAKAMKGLQP